MLVVSICSLKGGVGKTSVTLGIASSALARGVPTLVVDLDPQTDATTGLDVTARREMNVSDLLGAPRRRVLDQAIAPSGWTQDQPGALDVVLGSADAAAYDGPRASERALGRLAEALSKIDGYRLVLIDCPPSLGALTHAGLIASHRALVVTEPALFSVSAADRALRAVDDVRRGLAPDLQPLGVMVNRYRERSPEHRYRLEELSGMFGPLVLSPPIPERSALQQAQGASRPVHHWPGPAAAELAKIFDTHLARIMRSRPRNASLTPPSQRLGDAPPADQRPSDQRATEQRTSERRSNGRRLTGESA